MKNIKDIKDEFTLEHGEEVIYPHKFVKGYKNYPKDDDITDIDCKGQASWESVMEGFVCNKCEFYTGVK